MRKDSRKRKYQAMIALGRKQSYFQISRVEEQIGSSVHPIQFCKPCATNNLQLYEVSSKLVLNNLH